MQPLTLCCSFACCFYVPYLQVGVLSVRPLGGERQIQKVHQVVVTISNGLKAVICLYHLQDTFWDSRI